MKQLRNRMSVGEILQGARNLLAERWSQGAYVSEDGNEKHSQDNDFGIPDDDDDCYTYCSDGAMRRMIVNMIRQNRDNMSKSRADRLLVSAQNAVSSSIMKKAQSSSQGHAASDIWVWNDARGRTKEEVLEVFDDAIANNCRVVQQLAGENHDNTEEGA